MCKLEKTIKSLSKPNRIKNPQRAVKKWLWSIFRALLLIGVGYIILYPVIFMLSTALRGPEDYYDPQVIWVPIHFSLESFGSAMKLLDYWPTLGRTTFYSVGASIVQTMMCAITGYGLARFKFRGKNLILLGVILTIIVPTQTIIIPLYENYRFFDFFGIGSVIGAVFGEPLTVNLTNTGWVFYLPALFASGLRSGLFILVFMQSFRSFPKSISEAAYIDGCGAWKCYQTIILPNAVNSIITVFLFSVIWHWGDYYYSGMLMDSGTTLSIALNSLPVTAQTMFVKTSDPVANAICIQAGCLLVLLPPMILYFFTQRFFVESVERTGIVE